MSSSCNYWYIDGRIVVHCVHVNCKFLDLVISYGIAVYRYTDVPILIGASLISCMSKYIVYISGEIMMVLFRVPMPTPSASLTIYLPCVLSSLSNLRVRWPGNRIAVVAVLGLHMERAVKLVSATHHNFNLLCVLRNINFTTRCNARACFLVSYKLCRIWILWRFSTWVIWFIGSYHIRYNPLGISQCKFITKKFMSYLMDFFVTIKRIPLPTGFKWTWHLNPISFLFL
jgi:hypothetical protein